MRKNIFLAFYVSYVNLFLQLDNGLYIELAGVLKMLGLTLQDLTVTDLIKVTVGWLSY